MEDKLSYVHGVTQDDAKFTLATDGKKVSIAICSKQDNFCKKRGRIIASGRLQKNKNIGPIVVPEGQLIGKSLVALKEAYSIMTKADLMRIYSLEEH